MPNKGEPIGVFDSGMGGLTVLAALREKFPHESYVYIGDTARLPYGTKSPETIIRYSQAVTRAILKHGVKAIVVACNTASTHALSAVKEMAGEVPVLGMIEPAAHAAIKATQNNHIGVIGTFGTVKSDVYARTIKQIKPDMRVSSQACQMMVSLAEEGWADTKIAEDTVRKYITGMFESDAPDTLILGCTHFPVFEKVLREILGKDVTLINSGKAAADEISFEVNEGGNASCRFLATDDPARFAENAAKFFSRKISENDVELIDI